MSERGRSIDVTVAGLAVVDVIGRTMDMNDRTVRGGLTLLDSITLTTGGNVPNVAIDLRKLGFRTAAITRIGSDGLGDALVSRLSETEVNTEAVVRDPRGQTSATIVSVASDGERSFFHTRGCLRNFRVDDVLRRTRLLKRTRILVFGYYGLLPECDRHLARLFRAAQSEAGCRVLLDTGGTPSDDMRVARTFLPFVDYFVPSHEEAARMTGERAPGRIVKALRRAGARGVVGVKLGARGSYIDWMGTRRWVPPVRVRRVVDATGAGDAFVAGFVAATLKGYDPFEAAAFGNAVAADCVTAVGASTAIAHFRTYAHRRPRVRLPSAEDLG
jgi:sugar/nucleoside kinase (ribokinase family)